MATEDNDSDLLRRLERIAEANRERARLRQSERPEAARAERDDAGFAEELIEKLRYRQRAARRGEYIASVVAVVTLGMAAYMLLTPAANLFVQRPALTENQTQISERTAAKIASVERALAALESRVLASGTPSDDLSGLQGELASLATELKLVSGRVDAFETAIGGDAERALSLPLIRRDTEALGARVTEVSAKVDDVASTVAMIFNVLLVAAISLGVFNIFHIVTSRRDRGKDAS